MAALGPVEKKLPFDMGNIHSWTSWTDAFKCQLCTDSGFSCSSFEFTYWEYGVPRHVSEACLNCTQRLMKKDPSFSRREFWKEHEVSYGQLAALGLFKDFWEEEKKEEKAKSQEPIQGLSTDQLNPILEWIRAHPNYTDQEARQALLPAEEEIKDHKRLKVSSS